MSQIRNKLYDGNGNGWVGLNNFPPGWDDPNVSTRSTVPGNVIGPSESARKLTDAEIDKIKKASGSLISKTKCNSELVLIESSDPLETITEQSANYDLLILGTPEKDNWLNVLFGGGRDKFVQNSVCSVLRLTIK
mgnify:CR=1 FL=1